MDQVLVDWAVTAMDFGADSVRAEQWFTLLADAYQDSSESAPVSTWDEFVARLCTAAGRDGFDDAAVQYFVESLGNATSDPLGDVVLPLSEQRDYLPQEYLRLLASAESAAAADAGGQEVAEQDWYWDEARQLWHHLENNEWVAQQQNGYALNYDRTEWVPETPALLTAEPAAVDEPVSVEPAGESEEEWYWDEARQLWDHLEDNQWVPQVQNGYVLNYDRTEWLPQPAPPLSVQPEPTELTEPEAAEAEVVADVLVEDIEEAVGEIDGLELGDLSDDDFELLLNRLVE